MLLPSTLATTDYRDYSTMESLEKLAKGLTFDGKYGAAAWLHKADRTLQNFSLSAR